MASKSERTAARAADESRRQADNTTRVSNLGALAPALPAPQPTETGSVTYNPPEGDAQITTLFGKLFKAGESVQIDDPRQFAKLRGNPMFSAGGRKKAEPGPSERDEVLADLADEGAKAAEAVEEAREEADVANAGLSEAQRAQRHVEATREALASPDRGPPLTNHATQNPAGLGR